MTALSTNPGILIRLSTLIQGGWNCWVCNRFTPYECFLITRNGPRWLPCCTVECYRELPGVYDDWARQENEWRFVANM